MKKITLKISKGLKAALFVGGISVASLFGHGRAVANTLAFAPFALLAPIKRKVADLDADTEKVLQELETTLNADVSKIVAEAQKGLLTAEQVQEKVDAAKAEAQKAANIKIGEGEAAKSLPEVLTAQGTALQELKNEIEAGKSADTQGGMTLEKQAQHIKDLVAKVRKVKETSGETPFSVVTDSAGDDGKPITKAPVNMTIGNTQANASGVTVPTNYVYAGDGNPNPDVRVQPYITQFVDNGSTSLAAMPYTDKLPTEGTMAITAEGGLKPLLSVSWERRFSQAFKIAGRTKISEEALDDIPGIQSLINGELVYAHDIATQNAIYTHVNSFAPGFVAGALAASTTAPSNYDAVRAAIYAIRIASKGRFTPNAVVVNSADAYTMGATKDTTNQYVFPPFVMPDGTTISGVRIIETQDTTNVPAGTFFVGDWLRIHRRVYKPFNIRMSQMGIVSDGTNVSSIKSDFESNMYTTLGESRQHLYHYKNDETAFIKSTFAAVKTAIAA